MIAADVPLWVFYSIVGGLVVFFAWCFVVLTRLYSYFVRDEIQDRRRTR